MASQNDPWLWIERRPRIVAPACRIRVIWPGSARCDMNAAKVALIILQHRVDRAGEGACPSERHDDGRAALPIGLDRWVEQVIATRGDIALRGDIAPLIFLFFNWGVTSNQAAPARCVESP